MCAGELAGKGRTNLFFFLFGSVLNCCCFFSDNFCDVLTSFAAFDAAAAANYLEKSSCNKKEFHIAREEASLVFFFFFFFSGRPPFPFSWVAKQSRRRWRLEPIWKWEHRNYLCYLKLVRSLSKLLLLLLLLESLLNARRPKVRNKR